MPATLREVLKTNTFEQQRQIINTLAQDVYDITELGSTVSLLDGTLTEPSLFFSSDEQLGFYKSNVDEFSAVSDGSLVFRFSSSASISTVPFIASSASITNLTVGNLTASTNTNFGETVSFLSTLFEGTINDGRGYPIGTYNDIELTGGTGTGARANITVIPNGISTATITNNGENFVSGTLENIELEGGSGTGFVVDLFVGLDGTVSGVTIKNRGTEYQVNDILTTPQSLGGSNFAYRVDTVENVVSEVEIIDAGDDAYLIGDNLSANDSDFGPDTYTSLQFVITAFTKNAEFLHDVPKVKFNYDIDVAKDSVLATNPNYSVFIGYEEKLDRTSSDVGKLEVNGNSRFIGNVKSNSALISSLGSVRSPSIKFDTDPSSVTWDRTGFFGDISDGKATLNIVGDGGRSARFFSSKVELYKDTSLVSTTFGDPVIQTGSNYTLGNYEAVAVSGGSGSGLLLDITIGFEGTLVDPGSGYTDATFPDIPLSYYTLPGGAVETTTNLIGGSNYVDGSYSNVPLTGGTGNFATADITISSGSITNVTIVSGGTGYTINDTLSADTQDIGGSKLNTLTISNGGSNYTDGSYSDVPLVNTGSQGSGATIDVVVSGNTITSAIVNQVGSGYLVGDTFSVDPADFDSNDNYSFSVVDDTTGGSDPDAYTFSGDATGSDPTITVNKGDNLTFNINVSPPDIAGNGGNEFFIVTGLGGGGGFDSQQIATGVNNNGISFGTITWTPGEAGTYYYISKTDPNLQGQIIVLETASGSGLALTAATITTGSGFEVDVATVGTSAGGTGATATIEIAGGEVQSVIITDGGSGYQEFDELTVDYQDLQFLDPSGQIIQSVEPTTDFVFRITDVGSVSVTEVNDPGNGYEEGDKLLLPDSFRSGLTIVEWDTALQVYSGEYVRFDYRLYLVTTTGTLGIIGPTHTIGSQSNGDAILQYYADEYYYEVGAGTGDPTIIFEKDSGLITSKNLELTEDSGININNSLSISGSTILKSTAGNLTLSAANGYVEIAGTDAFFVPSGTTAERPGLGAGVTGAIRYNTTESRFEGFNGSFFVSLGGVRDVDGNTYISAELNPGDDDNTLRFVNDDVQSMQVEQTKITLQTIANIDRTNIDGVTEWEAGASATAPADPINDPPVLIYYEDRVYSVDTTGTFDASTPPTHTTGTVTNGDVDLTYIRSIYGSLTYTGTDLNLTLDKINLNTNGLRISSDNTVSAKLITEAPDFIVGFTNTDDPLLKLSSGGALSINNGFGGTENYIQVLDYELKQFDLKDTRVFSAVGSIDTSVGNAVNLIIAEYDNLTSTLPLHSGKLMIEIIDDSATPRRQYSEISFLAKSDLSDILYTENNKIYSDVELCDISVGIDGSNNITCDIVDLTGSSTTVYSIKVVSQSILV